MRLARARARRGPGARPAQDERARALPPRPLPPAQPPIGTTTTDDLARSLRVALADRSHTAAATATAARALLGRLAVARERPSPAVAGLADALAGTVSRALHDEGAAAAAAAGSLAANAALLSSLAQLRHSSLATKELSAAVGRQARWALTEDARGDRLVAGAPAAAAAAAATHLGWAPSARWLDATLAALTAASASPSSTPILAAAWADALEACVAARHAPGAAPAAAAAGARASPSLAARVGAGLAALGYGGGGVRSTSNASPTPPLVAALRARVCGGPRGSVSPPAAARAAAALGAWRALDAPSAAATLEHVCGDDSGGLLIPEPDAAALWAGVRRVGLDGAALSPRAARALAAVRAAGVAAAAATAAAGPPPGLEALRVWAQASLPGAGRAAVVPPDGVVGLLWAVEVGGGRFVIEVRPHGDDSSNLPPVALGAGVALAREDAAVLVGWEEAARWGDGGRRREVVEGVVQGAWERRVAAAAAAAAGRVL